MSASKPPGASRTPAASDSPSVRALDRIDRRLLVRLQQDGRAPGSQLAPGGDPPGHPPPRARRAPGAPTLERVRRLESSGYIEGYFARLNPRRLGLGLLAYVEVSLDRTTPDAF